MPANYRGVAGVTRPSIRPLLPTAVRKFLTSAALAAALALPATAQAADTMFFPQTGHSVSFGFKHFFDTRGGLDIYGYPTTEEIKENGWTVQYFQRARLEYHPEFAGTRYEVELGLLGDLTAGQTFDKAGAQPGARYYRETSHNLSGSFLSYFDARGGLDVFGYPTSEQFQRAGFTVQYFQRARMELHGSDILLGLLGDEYRAQQAAAASATTAPTSGSSVPSITPAQLTAPPAEAVIVGSPPQGQPVIRVGIFSASGSPATVNISGSGPFTATDASGRQLASFQGGQTVSVASAGPGGYALKAGQPINSSLPIRFVPSGGTILSEPDLPSYTHDFRGTLEVNFSAKSSKLWVIDELPLEDYVKGIGEEPEGLPNEEYKTLAVAYRTYALSTLQRHRGDSAWGEPFDIGSSTQWVAPYVGSNQIFAGYHRETLGPLLTQGEQATIGQIATYNGQVAVTPYYSHSDGRTRSWAEVWHGNDHPWLVSVPDPDDNGQTMLGHGVGMPLRSVSFRAVAGWSYDQILRYFYTGVQITKLY
jgi:Stage II sporulation protein